MAKKYEYINFIVNQLYSGNLEPENIAALFCQNFNKSKRTFYNYWDEAYERYAEEQRIKNQIRQKEDIKQGKKQVKIYIKTQEEICDSLNIIIDQLPEIINGKKTKITISDIINAIDKYCKIKGYFQATKVEHDLLTPVKIVLKNKPKSDDI